jgi:membrane protease YdiL (CAAX protease family)
MSILPADTSTTTQPVAPVQAAPVENAPAILWICIGWALGGMLVAWFLGVFRRRSIVGPQRLADGDSAWDMLVVLLFAYAAGILAYGFLFKAVHPTADGQKMLLQAASSLITFIIGIMLLTRIRRGALSWIGLSPRRITEGVAIGTGTLFVIYPFVLLASVVVEQIYRHYKIPIEAHEILRFLNDSKSRRQDMFAITLAVVLAPLSEELIFRGLLQTLLSRFFGWMYALRSLPQGTPVGLTPIPPPGAGVRWSAVITTSIVFAMIHPRPFWIPIFVLAIGLGYIYERKGNLWVTMTAHALFNTSQILFFLTSRH